MYHVTAVVVARKNSRRLPGKALQLFGGKTLIGHKIDQLKSVDLISEVVVGSDCDNILEVAHSHGASIRKRDDYHCDESQCSANEMIRNMAAMVETDIVVWAHPTNPLVLPVMYYDAINAFQREAEHDSLCSVTKIQRHAWSDGNPANFDPWGERHPFASELAPRYYQNGAIFIQRHQDMLRNGYFYGKNPLLFEIKSPYDIDIDTPRDLEIAKAIWDAMVREYENQLGGNK